MVNSTASTLLPLQSSVGTSGTDQGKSSESRQPKCAVRQRRCTVTEREEDETPNCSTVTASRGHSTNQVWCRPRNQGGGDLRASHWKTSRRVIRQSHTHQPQRVPSQMFACYETAHTFPSSSFWLHRASPRRSFLDNYGLPVICRKFPNRVRPGRDL
ncbi:hypothetical protein BDN72DRAFT_287562 [Pluteus cervinus]|uniref:Uncharacterized protein n=1 Tax=Pluteus cervinus TaxID=181527 RepID=A0ACD3AFF4_9AGAR|nr:hypothetical protein BDN72DRAFT_287562 [Pluteus cervinus]